MMAEISTMFVIMAAAESITVVDCCMLLLPNQSHSYRQLYRQPAGKSQHGVLALWCLSGESYVCLSHRGVWWCAFPSVSSWIGCQQPPTILPSLLRMALSLLYIVRLDIVVEERVLAEGAMRCCLEAAADLTSICCVCFWPGRTCSPSWRIVKEIYRVCLLQAIAKLY